jgi:hypothetical protein
MCRQTIVNASQASEPGVLDIFPATESKTKGVTTVSFAKVATAPRKFRTDIDMKKQQESAVKQRRKALEAANMKEWGTTFASRQDHRLFLLSLLEESHRYIRASQNDKGPSSPTAGSQAELRSRFEELRQRIEKRMSSAVNDPYMSCLEQLSELRLFSADRSVILPLADL